MSRDALALADSIGRHESGGRTFRGENCDELRGTSGEWGCFQILPATWAMWARQMLGYVPRGSYHNQRLVVAMVVQEWIDEGLSVRAIAWRYNSGRADKCISGTNRHGARYNSCAYADAVLAMLP